MQVMQAWTTELPMMQQTVLMTAVRGPDGLPKYNVAKYLLRWFRRCILLSAMDRRTIVTPYDPGGGSFTGPSFTVEQMDTDTWQYMMDTIVGHYIAGADQIPHHFQMHLLHAIEIVGYHHPDDEIATWWHGVYRRLVDTFHMHPESIDEMDKRLGDNRDDWLARSDSAVTR